MAAQFPTIHTSTPAAHRRSQRELPHGSAAGRRLFLRILAVASIVVSGSTFPVQVTAQGAAQGLDDVAGVFVLQSVGGRAVEPIGRITGGRLEISREGSWDMRINWRGDLFWARTYGDRGTLLRSGDNLTFVSNEHGDSRGTVQSGTLAMAYYWPVDEKVGRYVWIRDKPEVGPAPAEGPRREPSGSGALVWAMVSAGAFHACGLTTIGAAYCWGLRAQPAGSPGGDRPERVPGGITFSEISASHASCASDIRTCDSNRYHVCAIAVSGDAYCWGSNQFGQLGDGTTNSSATPRRVRAGDRFTSIAVGHAFTCGITTTAVLLCWGDNDLGELGTGSRDGLPHPVPQPVVRGAKAVTASRGYACALGEDGTAYCWGVEAPRSMSSEPPRLAPAPVATTHRFVSIAAGGLHVCALTRVGAAFCWGENNFSQAGTGDARGLARTPTPVQGVFSKIAAGWRHTCGISSDGKAYCWGVGNFGQLGTTADRRCGISELPCTAVPLAVSGDQSFTSVSAGEGFTCGVTVSGQAMCWGNNSRAQLGTGDRESRLSPAAVTVP